MTLDCIQTDKYSEYIRKKNQYVLEKTDFFVIYIFLLNKKSWVVICLETYPGVAWWYKEQWVTSEVAQALTE